MQTTQTHLQQQLPVKHAQQSQPEPQSQLHLQTPVKHPQQQAQPDSQPRVEKHVQQPQPLQQQNPEPEAEGDIQPEEQNSGQSLLSPAVAAMAMERSSVARRGCLHGSLQPRG